MSRIYSSRLGTLAPLVFALFSSACSCGGGETTGVHPILKVELAEDPSGVADYLLDFGLVTVGSKATRALELRNEGASSLLIQADRPALPFLLEQASSRLEVGVGAQGRLVFGYEPFEPMDEVEHAIVRFTTNEEKTKTYSVRLQGQGVLAKLDCEPSALDFGQVVQGGERTLELSCTNRLEVPLEVVLAGLRGNYAALFIATIPGVPDGRVLLEPGASTEVRIRFSATSAGRNDATLVFEGADEQELTTVAMVGETILSALAIEPTTCLDFGYVSLGETAERSLLLRNAGSEDLRVSRFITEDVSGAFEVLTQTPLVVSAGEDDGVEVVVRFAPQAGGKQSTVIGVAFTEGASDAVKTATACVSGFGGGPKLVCSDDVIDFRMVAVGIPVSRRITCANEGHVPPGETIDPLRLDELMTDNPLFEPSIRNQDGSAGAKEDGYGIGEGFALEVRYAPEAEAFDHAEIWLSTNGGGHTVFASGTGRDLEPCEFTVAPPSLRFGVVDRGAALTLAFSIENHLGTACLLSDLHLKAGSDPAFSVEPIESLELGPYQKLRVPVTFAPAAYQPRLIGTVQFQISNPDQPVIEVPLSGTADKPCFVVDPDPLDFGNALPGCQTRERVLTISNVCSGTTELTRIEVSETADSEAFITLRKPLLPLVLRPNQYETFTMSFQPQEIGVVSGAVELWSKEQSEPTLIRLDGNGTEEDEQTDHFVQTERPKVDILWVIDNSGSMDAYHDRIARNLPAFLSFTKQQRIDFQIGVTTSGLTPIGRSCPGGADGGEDGRLFPIDGSFPRILTPDMTDEELEAAWANNVNVGTCHGDEYHFEAAKRALSPPLINSVKSPIHSSPWDDGNAGFLRPEAALSIIFVEDETEHSVEEFPGATVEGYVDFFRSLKGPKASTLLRLHGITGPRLSRPTPGCALHNDAIISAIEMTNGTWMDMCTPPSNAEKWEAGLKKMSEGAFGYSTRFTLRGSPADLNRDGKINENDIEVLVNGIERQPVHADAQVWSFDPISNSIEFTPLYVPKPDSQISVTYLNACSGG